MITDRTRQATLISLFRRTAHLMMGELIDTLEHRGYVERRPDPGDGRARLVCLTAKGRQMVRTALREISAIEAGWTQAWTAAGLRSDLRTALEQALGETKTPQASPARPRPTTTRTAHNATPPQA